MEYSHSAVNVLCPGADKQNVDISDNTDNDEMYKSLLNITVSGEQSNAL